MNVNSLILRFPYELDFKDHANIFNCVLVRNNLVVNVYWLFSSFVIDTVLLSPIARLAASSANVIITFELNVSKSLVYNK